MGPLKWHVRVPWIAQDLLSQVWEVGAGLQVVVLVVKTAISSAASAGGASFDAAELSN